MSCILVIPLLVKLEPSIHLPAHTTIPKSTPSHPASSAFKMVALPVPNQEILDGFYDLLEELEVRKKCEPTAWERVRVRELKKMVIQVLEAYNEGLWTDEEAMMILNVGYEREEKEEKKETVAVDEDRNEKKTHQG